MSKQKKREYEIEQQGAAEYVVVQCPYGHRSRGMKVGELKLRMGLTCANPSCNAGWTAVVPEVMSLEAVP